MQDTLVFLSLLDILTSCDFCQLFKELRKEEEKDHLPLPCDQQIWIKSSQDCPLFQAATAAENMGLSPRSRPVSFGAHFLDREAVNQAMDGEELSFKAFLAGEQETSQSVPHW